MIENHTADGRLPEYIGGQ